VRVRQVYLGRVTQLAALQLGLQQHAAMPSLGMMAEAGVIVPTPFQVRRRAVGD
jgi:hypothetical protein